MTVCAYCGHTLAEHAGARCWGEVPALGGGWRSCRCTTTPTVVLPTPRHADWGG